MTGVLRREADIQGRWSRDDGGRDGVMQLQLMNTRTAGHPPEAKAGLELILPKVPQNYPAADTLLLTPGL